MPYHLQNWLPPTQRPYIGLDKATNLSHARLKVLEAARAGASIVVLPECFNSPYGTQHFPRYAEKLLPSPPSPAESPTFHALSQMAKESSTYLVGGSIPEYETDGHDDDSVSKGSTPRKEEGGGGGDTMTTATDANSEKQPPASDTATSPPQTNQEKDEKQRKGKYYNTSLTFSPSGTLLATHRKIHLFDISIPGPGGITFRESDVLTPGSKLTLIPIPGYGTIGVAICYDIRFPELAMIAARRGAFALIYPGAFNLTTGPLHWSLQARARAVDNQVYVALCSPARDMSEGAYHAWGHSLVVDPNAEVLVEAGEGEEVVYADLSPEKIEEVRRGIPLGTQRRFDVYPDVSRTSIVESSGND